MGKLEPGRYDLGYVVTWEDGRVLAPVDPASVPAGVVVGGGATPAVFARGEVVFPGALTVSSIDERAADAREARRAALASAEADACEAAEASWTKALQHRAGDKKWEAEVSTEVVGALAGCWARSSDGRERPEQVRRLMRSRRWDFEHPDYVARANPLAATLEAEGHAALLAQDWETAFRLCTDAVELDGTRSFARRYAEEARGFRLGIDPVSLAVRGDDDADKKSKAGRKQRKSTVIGKDHKFVRPPAKAPPEKGPTDEPEGEGAAPDAGPEEGPR